MRRYVVYATSVVAALALAFDVVQQLVFFESWNIAFRSWGITVAMAAIISAPIFGEVARGQLALAHANAKLKHLSDTDPLTGLMNRRGLLEFAGLSDGVVAVLILIDLDRFKIVNDRHGHVIGDIVLKSLADRLREEFGRIAVVCRFGGEEFAVMSSAADPLHMAERIDAFRTRIANMPIVAHGAALSVTLSAGIAIGTGSDFDQLYAEADRALYKAKEAGRNRVCVSADRRNSPAERRLASRDTAGIAISQTAYPINSVGNPAAPAIGG